jgi:hypothetical protein
VRPRAFTLIERVPEIGIYNQDGRLASPFRRQEE